MSSDLATRLREKNSHSHTIATIQYSPNVFLKKFLERKALEKY
jgi:hypothetical protein